MNADKLKADLKIIVANNPHEIKFTISYSDFSREKEIYDKKKDFGERILDILEAEAIREIRLDYLNTKGFTSHGTNWEIAKETKNIETLVFFVIREEEAVRWEEQDRRHEQSFLKGKTNEGRRIESG